MSEINIPPEARMAATAAYLETGGDLVAAIRGALKAWPGVCALRGRGDTIKDLILPLPPQEKQDG